MGIVSDTTLAIIGVVIGIVGLALTIYYGIRGSYAKRAKRQNQKIGVGSIGIQSGRDTNISR